MRFNFPFSWYNKFGTIPSTYKEAMSYEEQILWLCKHQDDLEKAFEEFQTTVSDLETLVNSFNSRINQNAIDIAGILDSIVTTISASSTDSNIPTAKSVYDFVTNYTPQGIITPLESTITLSSNLTLLNSGLYYTGNYVVRTTTGTIEPEEYVLMIPQDTLFYYDSTHDTFTLLYNYQQHIGDRWLNEMWYWYVDTSGVVPDTSHWEMIRYSATDSLDFPDDTHLPSSKAVVDYVSNYSQVFNEASLTNGAYFNLSVPTFIGTIISAPEVASNTSYVVFDLDEIKTTKFRVTGRCSNYVWFTTDINPLDTSFSPAIASLSNGGIGFTNEIVTITKTSSSNYVVFNFDQTDVTTPSVEVLETELDITQLINSSSNEYEVPSAKSVYQALQNASGIIPITEQTIRIWEMEQGIYKTFDNTALKYNGESGTEGVSLPNATFIVITNITSGSSVIGKLWESLSGTSKMYGSTTQASGTYNTLIYNKCENTDNKITSLSNSSTDTQYPSAKCVYDFGKYHVNGNANTTTPIYDIWCGTETEYNNLGSISTSTLYFIKE